MSARAAEPPKRGRGRPRLSENLQTATRLLDAATELCAELGFDGTTLVAISERAAVSSTAIYNHFGSREELLYAAAERAIEQLTALARETASGGGGPADLVAAYLRPDMRSTRRLLAELHLASGRVPSVAELLARWHLAWETAMLPVMPASDEEPRVTIKAFFLLLLGLCHVDDLGALQVPAPLLDERMKGLATTLLGVGEGVGQLS